MSTKKKKAVATGVRYTDAQKKEVVDFVIKYNAKNGRGGQSSAAKKFKVTPLTIGAWLKAAGAPGPVKKKNKAKIVKVSGSTSKKGMRYSPEKKQEVVDFVASYNTANGRGGQSQAAKKFSLSVLTVSAWLKAAGTSAKASGGKRAVAASAPAVSSALVKKVSSLIALSDDIRKAEGELAKLQAKFDTLKDSIKSAI